MAAQLMTDASLPRRAALAPGASPDALEAAVARRTGAAVVRHETHGSVVFVAGDRAFKQRKPLAFDFADLRSLERRRALAAADQALAEPLAPGVVLGVLDVVEAPAFGGVALAPAGTEGAIDVVVEMRRFRDEESLRALIVGGGDAAAACRATGARMARFHRTTRAVAHPDDPRAMVDRNLEGVLPLLTALLPTRERFAIQRFLAAFLLGWEATLEARAAAGLVVDGHGDLRAEHVLLGAAGDEVRIVDRLEHADLRAVDIADELGFLLMELVELTGAHDLGEEVLAGYREAGGSPAPQALLAFFGVHRALVRAKVALVRARQLAGERADDAACRAFHLTSVARRLVWRARGPMILLVTGPPACGKSTLARALAAASHLPVLSSDVVRRGGGAPQVASDYSAEARAAIYTALGARAAEHVSCIVDATFGEVAFQHAFLRSLPPERRADLLIIDCEAPLQARIERARVRAQAGTSLSQAGPQVVRTLDAVATPAPPFPDAEHLPIATTAQVAQLVDLVESWLDARLAAGGDERRQPDQGRWRPGHEG